MKYLHLNLLLFILIAISACGSSAEKSKNQEPDSTETPAAKTESTSQPDQENPAGKLGLDNGMKWRVNPETKEGIEKMKTLVAAGGDPNKLVGKLNAEFDTILKKCTMMGPAHDALHQYLLPLKGKFENHAKAGDEATRKDIEVYLDVFSNYFE